MWHCYDSLFHKMFNVHALSTVSFTLSIISIVLSHPPPPDQTCWGVDQLLASRPHRFDQKTTFQDFLKVSNFLFNGISVFSILCLREESHSQSGTATFLPVVNKKFDFQQKIKHPTSNNKHPTKNNKHPTSNIKYQESNNKYTTTSIKQQKSNKKQQTSNNKYPTTNNQQQTTNNKQQTKNIQ